MEPLVLTLIVFAALVVLPLVWAVVNFNRMVRVRQHMRESWSDIDAVEERVSMGKFI